MPNGSCTGRTLSETRRQGWYANWFAAPIVDKVREDIMAIVIWYEVEARQWNIRRWSINLLWTFFIFFYFNRYRPLNARAWILINVAQISLPALPSTISSLYVPFSPGREEPRMQHRRKPDASIAPCVLVLTRINNYWYRSGSCLPISKPSNRCVDPSAFGCRVIASTIMKYRAAAIECSFWVP